MGDEPGLLSADGRESLELPWDPGSGSGRRPDPRGSCGAAARRPFLTLVREKFGLPGDPDVGDAR
jgi:hypothetical protein